MGHWYDWWVRFLLIPVTIIALSIGVYEIVKPTTIRKRKWMRWVFPWTTCLLLVVGVIALYYFFPPNSKWQPLELPDGCQFISFSFAGGSATKQKREIPAASGAISLIGFSVKDADGISHDISLIGGHVSNNRFIADLLIAGIRGYKPFRLSGNKIEGQCPPEWQINYDANAVEIVNNDLEPLYQVVYRRPDVIEIYGEFAAPGVLHILKRDGMIMRMNPKAYDDPSVLGIKRIFKYPATSYPGKRIERNE